MPAVWLISDTHFGHEKTCTVFKRADGSPLRPFASAEEMDEAMVQRWNERIRPEDRVYHLGDVVIARKNLKILERLNGRKKLIRGNHDIWKLQDYAQYFDDILGYHVMNGLILSHVPIHSDSIERFGANVHGHLHANRVTQKIRWGNTEHFDEIIDPRYFNVSVEQIDFAPILFEDVCKRIVEQGGTVGFKNGNRPVM